MSALLAQQITAHGDYTAADEARLAQAVGAVARTTSRSDPDGGAMTPEHQWKLAGVDLEVTSTRKPYVSEWRYGVAAEGEASTVMRTQYFGSPLAAVQYMAKRGYTVVA